MALSRILKFQCGFLIRAEFSMRWSRIKFQSNYQACMRMRRSRASACLHPRLDHVNELCLFVIVTRDWRRCRFQPSGPGDFCPQACSPIAHLPPSSFLYLFLFRSLLRLTSFFLLHEEQVFIFGRSIPSEHVMMSLSGVQRVTATAPGF